MKHLKYVESNTANAIVDYEDDESAIFVAREEFITRFIEASEHNNVFLFCI